MLKPPPKAPDISIHKAAEEGNILAVKQHLAAGTDVNANDINKMNPLHYAVMEGHIEVAELLVAKGADVNAKNEKQITPFIIAVLKDHVEVFELLIENGANLNVKNKYGETILDEIASTNPDEPNKERVKKTTLLIRKNGGKHGTIHGAAGGGDVEAVKEFLATGMNVNSRDKKYYITPLDWAIIQNQSATADLLRKHGGKRGKELKAAGN